MYIGPWQEYKLAKILQLKEKLREEEEQENKIAPSESVSQQNNPSHAASNPLDSNRRELAHKYRFEKPPQPVCASVLNILLFSSATSDHDVNERATQSDEVNLTEPRV